MSLELSIFKRLLQEAILTHAEFLEKVKATYEKREKHEDDKILAKILELIEATQVHTLKGKANKSNRQSAVNLIDDAVKAMTTSGAISTSIQSLRRLYDSIIKYLAPDESGKRKSDVSFDQCIRYSDIFLKEVYPSLSADQKSRVDSGVFPYSEVFMHVTNFNNLYKNNISMIDVVYEDDIIKIVYPLDPQSFSEYVLSNKPNILWNDPWCTLSPNTWSSYHKENFLTVAYIKEHYKKDHSLSLISLKTDLEGNVLYGDTCDYYNKHMDEDLKKYLSEDCIISIKNYFENFEEKRKENILKSFNKLKSLASLGKVEDFTASMLYINANDATTRVFGSIEEDLINYLKSLPPEFFNEVIIEFISNTNIFASNLEGERLFIGKFFSDIIMESFSKNDEIWKLFYQKALKRNLNPRYAKSFINLLGRTWFSTEKSLVENLLKEMSSNDFSLIISNACNSNNPRFFESSLGFLFRGNVKEYFTEEDLDKFRESIFLSKSYSSYVKENKDYILRGHLPGIDKNYEFIANNIEKISQNAGLEKITSEDFSKGVATFVARSKCTTLTYGFLTRNKEYLYQKFLEEIEEANIKYKTKININDLIFFPEDSFAEGYICFMYTVVINNSKAFLEKHAKTFVDYILLYLDHLLPTLILNIKAEQVIRCAKWITDILLLIDRSEVYNKINKSLQKSVKKIPVTVMREKLYTSILGTNIAFDELIKDYDNKFPGLSHLYKIPGFKKSLQTYLLTFKHEEIFRMIFLKSIPRRKILESKLFERQIKFISDNFNTPTFINLLKEFFIKNKEPMLFAVSKRPHIIELTRIALNEPLSHYLSIDIFNEELPEDSDKESTSKPEELVRDYVKTQL